MTSHAQRTPVVASGPEGVAPAYAHPDIDLVHLSRQTMGDKVLESELLRLFATQARVTARSLAAGGGSNSPADLLHLLCGSARAVGCWGVAEEAQQLEGLMRGASAASPASPGRDRLDRLGRSIEQACRTIDDLLGERD